MHLAIYTYMYVKAVNEEEVTNSKESRVGGIGSFGRDSGKEEMVYSNYDLKICF